MAAASRRRREPTSETVHPLLARRPEKNALFLVLSGDRGLCGAFNTNINKAAERAWREKEAAGVEVVVRDGRPQGPRVPRRAAAATIVAGLPAHLRRARPRQGAPRRALARRRASRRARSTRSTSSTTSSRARITQKVDGRAACCRSPSAPREPERRRRRRAADRVPLRARPARAARAARADVRRDHASTARCSRARRASSARR